MKIELKEMTSSYTEGVFNVGKLSLKEAWSLDSINKELGNKNAKYIVAVTENNEVVGFIGLWIVLDEGDITNVAVHPNYRKQKIASLLIEYVINNMKNWNISSLTLEVRKSNIPAQNLYKKFNFNVSGIRKNFYSDNNEDAYIMWLKL
ncbi:MAG: ribosomal protein S18-alanine N-acetyltransferase [Clostridium sp.]|nr:ribosomal protein S18-alanine N-acetyltransferase [Clostridium sp.]